MSAAAVSPPGRGGPDARNKVMTGCVVLITADRRSAELAAALTRRGATVRHAPAMSIVPHADDEALIAGTKALIADPPDVVVVTTGIGFRGWIEAADAVGVADDLIAILTRARLVARGPKARGAIQAAGLTADWVAESEVSSEIAEVLLSEGVDGLRIAVQHHGAGADGLDDVLEAGGADVESLIVYRWGPPPDPEALALSVRQTAAGEFDAVVFTSAPGADAWLRAADTEGCSADLVAAFTDGATIAAAVGPVTARPLESRGIEPMMPERGRLGALVRTLVSHYERTQSLAVDTVAGRLLVHRQFAVLDGLILPLSPSGVAVLRLLIAHPGEVVSRDAVLDALPGDSRDPHAAEVAIARLRDATDNRALIKTVVRRGYRLELAP